MQTDPILREVYRIKDELNRETGGDVGKLMESLHEYARQHPERMVQPPQKVAVRHRRRTATTKPGK